MDRRYHRSRRARVWAAILAVSIASPGCKPRRTVARTLADEPKDGEVSPELKSLIDGEATFQAALVAMRPAMRASATDFTSLIPFNKLDSLIKPWWDQATASFDETGPPPPTIMAAEVSRQLVARQIRLRHAMGFADADTFAREKLAIYFSTCSDYLACAQMIATMGDFVQILPAAVLSHLTDIEFPALGNIDGWSSDFFAQHFDNPQILQTLSYDPEDEELIRIIRYQVKALALTALFYHATKIESPVMRGWEIRLEDNHTATLGLIIDRLIEEARCSWLIPGEPKRCGWLGEVGKPERRTQDLKTELQKIYARYFDEEKKSGEDALKGLKPEMKEAFYLRATHVVNAVVKTIQGIMSLQLYLQRLRAPSTRDWVRLMNDEVEDKQNNRKLPPIDAETAILTYGRFMRHEATLPGRAIYLEGMLRRMQASDVQKASAKDDAGNVQFVPQPTHKTWATQGDVLVSNTDMHLDVMLKDNFSVPDLSPEELAFPECSRRAPNPKYAIAGRTMHGLIRCEEYLAKRDRLFHSLLKRVETLENSVDFFTKKQNIVLEEQEKLKADPALNRWAKSITDEFHFTENPTEVHMQSAMGEFFKQLISLHCYRLPLLKTLPYQLEAKLAADPNPAPVDVIQACAPTEADKALLRNREGPLPNFDKNVGNYLTTRAVSKYWKDFGIQATLLVANAIVVAPIGPIAAGVTKGAAWAAGAIRATALASKLGMPRFTFHALRIIFEMTAFTVIHKASTIGILLAWRADNEMILSQAWDSQRSWWDNLGESVTLGVATVLFLPYAGNFANKFAGRFMKLRNSVHFAKSPILRKAGFAALAIPIENAAFPVPGLAFKFAEDAWHGRLAEVDTKQVLTGVAADYVHSLPVSMVFRAWHGVGGMWVRAPFRSDIRAKLSKIIDDTQVYKFAAEGYERGLNGTLTEAYVKEVQSRVAQTRERAKELDEQLHEYYMMLPEVVALYPDQKIREKMVRDHIEAFRTERSPMSWLDEFADEPIKKPDAVPESDYTGFEGL